MLFDYSDYVTVSAPGKWEYAHRTSSPNHGGMTGWCRWRMPAHLHRLEGAQTEGKAALWSVPARLYALWFLLYALCVLAEQDCGPCKGVLCTAFLCTRILGVTTSLCNIREASIAVESAQIVTIIRDYVTIIAIISSIIRIMPQPNVAFWVGIHCRLQANRIIHHGTTVFIASGSGVDSTIDHEGAFSHRKADMGLVPVWVRTTDVGKPPNTHGRTKLIAQAINGSGNRRPLVRPHVVRKSKLLTNLQ